MSGKQQMQNIRLVEGRSEIRVLGVPPTHTHSPFYGYSSAITYPALVLDQVLYECLTTPKSFSGDRHYHYPTHVQKSKQVERLTLAQGLADDKTLDI